MESGLKRGTALYYTRSTRVGMHLTETSGESPRSMHYVVIWAEGTLSTASRCSPMDTSLYLLNRLLVQNVGSRQAGCQQRENDRRLKNLDPHAPTRVLVTGQGRGKPSREFYLENEDRIQSPQRNRTSGNVLWDGMEEVVVISRN